MVQQLVRQIEICGISGVKVSNEKQPDLQVNPTWDLILKCRVELAVRYLFPSSNKSIQGSQTIPSWDPV